MILANRFHYPKGFQKKCGTLLDMVFEHVPMYGSDAIGVSVPECRTLRTLRTGCYVLSAFFLPTVPFLRID